MLEERFDLIKEFEEAVIEVKRVSKKTKGGNQIRFTALVVVGDKKGRVGVSIDRAEDVRGAISKAIKHARERMIRIPIKGTTIPFDITVKFKAAKVFLKPAPRGSGVIAGGPVRTVLEVAGIRDAVGKILGSNNKASIVYATMKALKEFSDIRK